MRCDACGGEVPAESLFCPKCGAQLGEGSDSEPADDSMPDHEDATTTRRFKNASRRDSGKQPQEEELWAGTYSAKAMGGSAVLLAIFTVAGLIGGALVPPFGVAVALVAALVLWAAWGLLLLYRRMTVRYRLTTFRLFHESGLLSRKRDRIEVIDINDVTLRQGIVERMFNTGTVHIESSDTSDPEFDMVGIDDVRHVADLIDNTRRAERQRRGLFMENI
jgi:membrane protein YdbS with pleckstrin-like domain